MIIKYTGYNNAEQLLLTSFSQEWHEIYNTLTVMPLHLKPSDQQGKIGQPIFDPVGTNAYIKTELKKLGWKPNIPIPQAFRMWGTDIDYGKTGVIGEAQFSNYPFLLNNLLRSELFYKAKIEFTNYRIQVVIIITKAQLLPASNSTLYYEQAVQQINSLAPYKVFDVPLVVIGLFEPNNLTINAIWTEYHTTRYSRTIHNQYNCQCQIQTTGNSRRGRVILL